MYLSKDGGLHGATKPVYPKQDKEADKMGDQYNAMRAAAMDMGLTEDEAEREIEDMGFADGPESFTLIHLCESRNGEHTAWDESRRFCSEWNRRYPGYMAVTKSENRGEYPSVQIADFGKAAADTDTFPKGPEQAATNLADELGCNY